jgi:hypothetical protein
MCCLLLLLLLLQQMLQQERQNQMQFWPCRNHCCNPWQQREGAAT